MKKFQLHRLYGIAIAMLCIVAIPLTSQAATKAKPKAAATKERLVLMPLRVPEEDKNLTGAMETALVEGLQQKYEVFSGEQVAQKARQIFMKESRNTAHKECDETRCMQGIAEAFQAELIATANITKQEGSYFIALSIQNIFDNKVVDSKSKTCENCKAVQVIDKLKELVVTAAPIAAEPLQPKFTATDPESSTWAEAQKGNTADDYQVYLDAYPKGKYVLFSKAKLKKLKEAEQALAEQREQQAWDAAQQENSAVSLNRYLQAYPAGRFAGFAKSRIAKLKVDLAYKEETDLWNKAESGMDKAAVENYLGKYPAGRYIVQASSKLKAIKEEETKGPAMVTIPAGNVQIGASTERDTLVRTVSIRSFEIGKYEVTQKEWREVMGNNPSEYTSCGDTCPVEKVSWDDIKTFLQKINAKTGRQYRLPTEAEWEYACYGGSQTEYCGSSNIDSVAWNYANSNMSTHPVGQKQANGYGLHDMSGNVGEWMQDELLNDLRAFRGGDWYTKSQLMRAAFSRSIFPSNRNSLTGFRLARTLP